MAHLELICADRDLDDKRRNRAVRGEKAAAKRHLRPLACHCHCHEKIVGAAAEPCEHTHPHLHAHPEDPWHSDTEGAAGEPATHAPDEPPDEEVDLVASAHPHEQPTASRASFEPLSGLMEPMDDVDPIPLPLPPPVSLSIPAPSVAGEDLRNSCALTSHAEDQNSRLSDRSAPSAIGGDEPQASQTASMVSAPAAATSHRFFCIGARSSHSHDSFRLPEHHSVIPDSDPEDESESEPAAAAAALPVASSPGTNAKHFVAPNFPVLSSVSTCSPPTTSRLLSGVSAATRAARELSGDRDDDCPPSSISPSARHVSGSSNATSSSPSAARASLSRTPDRSQSSRQSQQPSSFFSSTGASQRPPSAASASRLCVSPVASRRRRNAAGSRRPPLPLVQRPSGSRAGSTQSTQSSEQSQWLQKQATLPALFGRVERSKGLLPAPPQAAAATVASASSVLADPPTLQTSSRSAKPVSRARVPLETIVLDDDDDDEEF